MGSASDRIIDAAMAAVLDKGIAAASLRDIAKRAGVSLGAIDHHWDGRGHLLNAVIDRAAADHIALVDRCCAALRDLIPLTPAIAVSVARRWLTEAEPVARRTAQLASAFLAHDARSGVPSPGLVRIIAQEEALWRRLFEGHPDQVRRAAVMAAYLHDERPFALSLGEDVHYPMLRDITLASAAHGFRRDASARTDFDAIVSTIAVRTRPIAEHRAPSPGSRAAALSDHVATVILQGGVAAVTHRRVAREAGAPSSSVAHHFPTRSDLMQAGVDALYLRMWRALADTGAGARAQDHGRAVIRMTHDIAVAAHHEPGLRLFALDMRRRRAENAQSLLVGPDGFDRAGAQALIMAYHGESLAAQASGLQPPELRSWLAGHAPM